MVTMIVVEVMWICLGKDLGTGVLSRVALGGGCFRVLLGCEAGNDRYMKICWVLVFGRVGIDTLINIELRFDRDMFNRWNQGLINRSWVL